MRKRSKINCPNGKNPTIKKKRYTSTLAHIKLTTKELVGLNGLFNNVTGLLNILLFPIFLPNFNYNESKQGTTNMSKVCDVV